MRTKIYPTQQAAIDDMPKCPRPKNGSLDHWFYIDRLRLPKSQGFIPCACGTCGARMRLSLDNPDEWPAT